VQASGLSAFNFYSTLWTEVDLRVETLFATSSADKSCLIRLSGSNGVTPWTGGRLNNYHSQLQTTPARQMSACAPWHCNGVSHTEARCIQSNLGLL